MSTNDPSSPMARNDKGYLPCPSCQSTSVDKVGFTWWGGFIGPRMFTHVKCAQCGTAFNGNTGRSNSTAITIYFVVLTAIAIAIGISVASH